MLPVLEQLAVGLQLPACPAACPRSPEGRTTAPSMPCCHARAPSRRPCWPTTPSMPHCPPKCWPTTPSRPQGQPYAHQEAPQDSQHALLPALGLLSVGLQLPARLAATLEALASFTRPPQPSSCWPTAPSIPRCLFWSQLEAGLHLPACPAASGAVLMLDYGSQHALRPDLEPPQCWTTTPSTPWNPWGQDSTSQHALLPVLEAARCQTTTPSMPCSFS